MTATLVVAIDGSPAATHAVELLGAYCGDPGGIKAVLLNVQKRAKGKAKAGAAQLQEAAARLAGTGIPFGEQVRTGPPAPAILRESRRQQAEVILMGTRGTGAVQGFALGSVALRVVHRATVPVILVKPEDRLPATPGKRLRVLLAMDGSAPALRAAERLVAWRNWLGELEVHLVWVQEPITVLEAFLPPHDDVVEHWSTQEGEQATAAARSLFAREGIPHQWHQVVGDPAREICALAQKTGAELVALGTRGLGAAHHALIGSVALKVAAIGEVPTLLVR